MPNRMTEMMTKVSLSHLCTVRVWSIAKEGDTGPDDRVVKALNEARQMARAGAMDVFVRDSAVDAIEALGPDVVAAYEILDERGNGAVVYPDWK